MAKRLLEDAQRTKDYRLSWAAATHYFVADRPEAGRRAVKITYDLAYGDNIRAEKGQRMSAYLQKHEGMIRDAIRETAKNPQVSRALNAIIRLMENPKKKPPKRQEPFSETSVGGVKFAVKPETPEDWGRNAAHAFLAQHPELLESKEERIPRKDLSQYWDPTFAEWVSPRWAMKVKRKFEENVGKKRSAETPVVAGYSIGREVAWEPKTFVYALVLARQQGKL